MNTFSPIYNFRQPLNGILHMGMHTLYKMWHGFSRVFLTAVWSKMRPNPHGKSHHFLSKCHGNFMTWTCPKFMACSSMENKSNLDKWHGIVMDMGVDLSDGMTRTFFENPYHIFYRLPFIFNSKRKWRGFSRKFHVISFHKLIGVGPNWHLIPWPFHVMYPGFICCPCWDMTWILVKFRSWNFHGIC